MKKIISILTLSIVILVTGCQLVTNLYPAKTPYTALRYADPNRRPPLWESIDSLDTLRQNVIETHLGAQIDLKYEMEKDTSFYNLSLAQVNTNIQQATDDRQLTIGTLNNPGWLLGLIFGTTGLGAYVVGLKTARKEDWTEAEHQLDIKTKVAEATAAIKPTS